MSRTGYIYKIAIKDASLDDCYIGSTDCIRKRKWQHKSDCNNENSRAYNFPVYQFIRSNGGFDNFDLYQIKKFKYDEVTEKRMKERKYIEKLKPTLNCRLPNKYTNDNWNEYQEEWREDNKDKIKIKKKIKVFCNVCDKYINKYNFKYHVNSYAHKKLAKID